jgi:uncharacterized protein YjgD (DUF1641 family)
MNAVETPNQAPAANTDQALLNLLNQLAKPEVQQSLTVLIENLPRLTEVAQTLTSSYEVVKTMSNDPVFVADVKGGFDEIVMPVVDKAKGIAANVLEAKDRAEQSTETIGIFGLLKMINDPQAQKLFRFVNAYLAVANEKDNQR